MVSLVDVAPAGTKVAIRGTKVDVQGVSVEEAPHVASFYEKHGIRPGDDNA